MESPGWSQDPMGKHSQYGETMIEIGTLVKYHHDGDYGIVVDFLLDDNEDLNTYYEIKWCDGTSGHHLHSEFEVIA